MSRSRKSGRRNNFTVNGCSHHGIGNILRNYHEKTGRYPDVVIRGFHLKFHTGVPATDSALDAAANAFALSGTLAYPCHCTGATSIDGLKRRLGERIRGIACGQTLVV